MRTTRKLWFGLAALAMMLTLACLAIYVELTSLRSAVAALAASSAGSLDATTLNDVHAVLGLVIVVLLVAAATGVITSLTIGRRIVATEDALHASEELYGQTLQALPAHIAVLDPRGHIVTVNQAWHDFAAANDGSDLPGIAVGGNYLEVCRRAATVDDDARAALTGIESVLNGSLRSFTLEYPCHSPCEQRWFLMTAVPLRSDTLRGAVITHLDITERKHAELHAGFLNRLQPILMQDGDADAMVRSALNALSAQLQIDLAVLGELTPDTSRLTLRHAFRAGHPGARGSIQADDLVTDAARELIAGGGELVVGDVASDPRTAGHVDTFRELAVGAFAITPLIDSHGPTRMLGIATRQARTWRADEVQLLRDVAARLFPAVEQARAETALRDSEQSLASIVESAMNAIIVVDERQRIELFNPAAEYMFGLSAAEVKGEPVERLIPDRFRQAHDGHVRRFAEHGPATLPLGPTGDLYGLRANGDEFPIEAAISQTTVAGGRRFTVILRDITDRRRAEQALRDSEQRLRLAAEAAGFGSYDYDLQAGRPVWSPQLFEILGLPQATEASESLFMELVHPDDREWLQDHLHRTLDPAGPGWHAVEFRIVRGDGELRWLRDTGRAFFVGDGDERRAVRLVGTAQDITERRRNEEALRKSQAQLRLFVEQAPISIALLDRDLRYIATSNRWLAEFGRGHLDLVGHHHYEVNPDLNEAWKLVYRRALAGAHVKNDGDLWIQADGSRHWHRWAVLPWTDDTGEIGGLIIAAEDITRNKRAEEALRQSQADLERAQAVGHIGSWRLDVQRDELHWSPENHRIFGVPEDTSLRYESFLAAVHPDDRDEVDRRWQAALRGEPYDVEHRVLVDGRVKWVRELAELEFDDDGTLRGGFGTTQDVTDRRRAEEALREADRRKDAFLATLAHELRNPLAPIRNAVEILKRQAQSDPPVRNAQAVIERQLQHMVRLIDDLLDVGRITRGRLELRRVRVNLADILEQALETSRPHITAAGHQLHVRLPAQAVPLDADPVRLAQVFVNLLNNASKYTEPGGQITLTASRLGDEVVVTVRDTGTGLAAEQIPHLFDPFTQAGRDSRLPRDGLGIGLSLARSLARMHGGDIEARSDGPGRGSTFTVRLPLPDAAAAAAVPVPPAADTVPTPPRRRILVVDDNRDIVDTLSMLLRLDGNEVETAFDGLEAVAAAERHRPDVILLDIGMPSLDGYAACRRIREQAWGKDMTIIALTGWGQEEDQRKSGQAGFDAHLVKPVEMTALQRILGRTARQREGAA